LNIDRDEFKDLRAKIHICSEYGSAKLLGTIINKKGKVIDTTDKLRRHLIGKLNYFNKINPERMKSLKLKLNKINWEEV
jgi:hypothetical protein